MERLQAGGHGDGGFVATHQGIVQARTRQAAEHRCRDIEIGGGIVEHAGHDPGAIQTRVRDAIVQGLVHTRRQGRHVGHRWFVHRAARDVAEIFLHQRLRRGDVDVAGDGQHGIVGAVVVAVPLAQVFQAGRIEVGHRTDRRMPVRMAFREQAFELSVFDKAIRLVIALAFFVLHDAALVVEALLVQRAEQMAHAVAFHVQGLFDRRSRHSLEEIRAVEPSRAVPVGGAHRAQGLHQAAGQVLGRIEQADMLEQMRVTGLALGFVLGTDVVPGLDRDDRHLAVGMHDHAQAVVQRERLVGNIDAACELRGRDRLGGLGGGDRRRKRQADGDEQSGMAHGFPRDELPADRSPGGRGKGVPVVMGSWRLRVRAKAAVEIASPLASGRGG